MPTKPSLSGLISLALFAAYLGTATSTAAPVTKPDGVSLWFQFEGSANDSESGLSGVENGQIQYRPGVEGLAARFQGGSHIGLPAEPRLEKQDFTLETWVRRRSVDAAGENAMGAGVIFGGSPGAFSLVMSREGRLYMSHVAVESVFAEGSITDTSWHHVALVKAGANLAFYIDGQGAGTATYTREFTFGGPFAIGALGTPVDQQNYAFFGDLDDLAFYPRSLSASEVSTNYLAYDRDPRFGCTGVVPGAVSWWQAEEGGQDTLGANDGELVGGAEQDVGFVDRGFHFRGGASRVLISNAEGLNLQDLTIEMWIRRENTSVVSDAPAGAGIFAGGLNSYGMVILHGGGLGLGQVGAARFDTGPRIVDTDWHHIAATKSGRIVRIYVDGQETDQGEVAETFAPSELYAIGAGPSEINSAYYSFLGWIDEVGVYNRPLTGAEIAEIWSAGERGKCFAGLALNLGVPEEVVEGLGFSYAVNVLNQGTNRLDGVVVTNRVPAGFEVLETQPEAGTTQVASVDSGTEVVWSVGALDPGVARRLWIRLGAGPLGTHRLLSTAVKGGAEPGPVVGSGSFLVRPVCSPVPQGLLSWWRGESNTVEQITQVAGLGASGVGYQPGRIGAGFVLDGGQDTGIQLGTPVVLQRSEFSIEGWLRRADLSAVSKTSPAATILGAGGGGWNFGVLNTGALTFGKGNEFGVTAAPSLTDGDWHHVAVTRDAREVRFYTDGALVSTHPYETTFALNEAYGLGGNFPSGNHGFWGSLDEVAFYERILTAPEIAAIASAGGAPKCVEDLVLTVSPGGPIPVGEDWEVTLTVQAAGQAESTQVLLTASIPPGMQYQSASASQGTVENLAGVLRASLGPIPAAGSAQVRLVLRPLLAGNYVVSATVQRQETELSSVNNRVEVAGGAVPLTVSVTAPEPVIEPAPLEVEVVLSAPSRGTVRVAYQTEGVTATAGADYETQAGVLEFLPGTVRQVVRVPVAADGIYETDETLRMTLGTPEGAGAGVLTALAVIRSPEPLPVARVAPLILTEGNLGTTPMRFEVQLDRPSGLPARLRFATTNDSAKAPTDYVAAEGLLELAPGETNAVIEVLVHGDTSEEPNETVVVTFSDLEGLRMPTASVVSPPVPGIGTIVNDDAVPGLARSFTWDAVPAEATTGVPFAARLTARDGIGDVASAFNGAVAVRGYAGPGAPSSVVLTEIALGTQRGVELQNVSPDPVDISGWQIHLYDVARWPAPQLVFTVPSTTVLAPAAVASLEVVRNSFQLPGTFPRFRVLGDLFWPRPNPQQPEVQPPIGVVVADASGAVADTFFTGGADPQQIGVPKVLTAEDWSGPAANPWSSGIPAPATFIRPSGQSRNTRSGGDWVAATMLFNGFGSPNPGLVLPFEDAIPLPVAPEAVTGFASGVWTGDLALNGYSPVVRLLADDGNGRRGLSGPIRPTVVDDLQVQFTVTPVLLAAPRVEGTFEVTVTNAGPVVSSNVTATVLLAPRYGGGPNVVQGTPQLSQGTARVRTLLRPLTDPQVEIVADFGEVPAGGVATMRLRASRTSGFGAPVTTPERVVSTVSVSRQPLELNQINNQASASQELAQPCSDLGEGTVAWWRGAGDFQDALGAHPGTAVGSAALGEGRVGSTGFHFSGGDGVVRVADAEALDFKAGEGFSMELWFLATPDAGRSIGLIGKGLETPGSRGYGIGVEDGRVVVRLADGERSDAISGFLPSVPDVRDGQWHHLMVSANRGETPRLSVWIDGVATSDPSPLGAVGDLSNDAPLELGGRAGGVASWAGDLDEVILRRTAVTAAEAQAGYRSGGHGRCTSVLEIQLVTPRFLQEAGQWVSLDRGVVGQPYRFGFELRNRGPLASGVRLFASPGIGETNFVLNLPTGPVLPDPVEGAAIAELGSVAANAVIPMSVDWTGSRERTRGELLALGLEPTVRSGLATIVIELAADTDRDGMPDEYELSSGLDLNSPADAIGDTDLDGYTAAEEFEAGTRANDGASRLALVVEGSRASLQVLASRVYRLERSSALGADDWEVIQTFRPEVDGSVAMDLPPSDSPEIYYRVVALLPY